MAAKGKQRNEQPEQTKPNNSNNNSNRNATQRNAMRGRPTTLLSICYWLPVVRYFITNLTESELFGVRVVEESERERRRRGFSQRAQSSLLNWCWRCAAIEMSRNYVVKQLLTVLSVVLYTHTLIYTYIRGVHLPVPPWPLTRPLISIRLEVASAWGHTRRLLWEYSTNLIQFRLKLSVIRLTDTAQDSRRHFNS